MRIPRRLTSRIVGSAGETLVETLVSILVSAMALLLLATAISAAVNSVRVSNEKMQEYYAGESSAIAESSSSTTEKAQVDLGATLKKDGGQEVEVQVYENKYSGLVLYKRSES